MYLHNFDVSKNLSPYREKGKSKLFFSSIKYVYIFDRLSVYKNIGFFLFSNKVFVKKKKRFNHTRTEQTTY